MRIQYNNASAFMRGSARQLEALAVQNGTKLVNRIGMKVAFGTATIGARLLENAAEEMTQEGFENILTDVWLNITGAQDKELGAIIDDAARVSIMAAILSPVLSGESYLLTSKGKVLITDNERKWTLEWMDGKITETMQNPDALTKAIHAEAAAQTIDTLANGGLKDVNASAVEKTRDDLKKAEANVAKAANTYNAARTRYADEMHKCSVSFTAMSDEKHDLFMQTLLSAKNAYQSAIKAVSDLKNKLKLDQGVINRLLSGIIANARAEGKENAQTSILSEAAARRMDAGTQKADGIKQAAAQTGQPSPENVSNEGGPIAQGSDSGIMIENGQGEVGVRDTGNADRLTSVDAGKADIYNANGNPELRSLRRPIFDSMLNDGFEIDGNKFRLNKHAYNTLFKSQRKDIMPADISEALKTKPISGNPGSLKYVNPVTGTKIFVNPETNEIVGVWPAGFRN
jgi:regulator of replication initiation timing